MRRALMLVGAVWPLIYVPFFVLLVVEATVRGGGDPGNDLLIPFAVLLALHLATMVLVVCAAVAYVIHAWRNPRLVPDQRTLWVIVLILGGPIAMPIYWWIYVRPSGAGVGR